MYTVAVRRDFIAQHYLIGGDWGAENELHSHHYVLELQLHGDELDRHDYLVDIVEIEQLLKEQISRYRDHTLNDLPEFSGLNPSIELFVRLLVEAISGRLHADNIHSISAQLWENETAWAGYHHIRLEQTNQ